MVLFRGVVGYGRSREVFGFCEGKVEFFRFRGKEVRIGRKVGRYFEELVFFFFV